MTYKVKKMKSNPERQETMGLTAPTMTSYVTSSKLSAHLSPQVPRLNNGGETSFLKGLLKELNLR